MLNIHELQVFLAAAETENFSEAGRRLNISQPAVSMQIRGIETRLGMELFCRSGRHITLTEAGRALIPMARQLVSQAIEIEETMASMQGNVVGQLKIGCSASVGKYILPKLLAELHRRHPAVDVVCCETRRDQAVQMLRDGEFQIALTSLRTSCNDIEFRSFLVDDIVLIIPHDHPWANTERPVKPIDLEMQDFIMREETSGTMEALREAFAQHGISLDHLNTVMVLGNVEATRMAVQEGIGVAFISRLAALEAASRGGIHVVDVEGLTISQSLYMAYHADRPVTRAQAAFWEMVFSPQLEHLRDHPTLFSQLGAQSYSPL